MLGSIVNVAAVVIGSAIGLLMKRGLSQKITDFILVAIGLYIVYIGIMNLSSETDMIVLLLAVAFGAGIGVALDIDGALNRLAKKVQDRFVRDKENSRFAEGMVGFFLISCTGAYTIIACFDAGMGNYSMLYTKAALDFIVTMMMASTIGIGVMFSAIPLFAYQAVLTIFSGILAPVMSDTMIDAFACAGGLITIPIGTNMMGITNIKIADLIPVLFLAPIFAAVRGLI